MTADALKRIPGSSTAKLFQKVKADDRIALMTPLVNAGLWRDMPGIHKSSRMFMPLIQTSKCFHDVVDLTIAVQGAVFCERFDIEAW